MSFENGSVNFRMFYVPKPMPEDMIQRFAAQAMPAIETLTDGTIQGWVTGRHLLDRNITDETATFGGYLRLCLAQAERKVPEALLRAECKMEELAHCQAHGVDKVSGSVRSEIRRSIQARLTPQAQPQIRGIPFVYDQRNGMIYAGCISDKQVDAFQIHFIQATGFTLIPVTPDTAAIHAKVNVRDWMPASFSAAIEDDAVSHDPGMDFLTWLWFGAEARGGQIPVADVGSIALMIEGPLLLTKDGCGAHEAALRKGEPLVSNEAKAALLDGKKLRRAKLTLALGDQAWICTIDAPSFTIRGLKLPEGEKLDQISKFQERMDQLDTFRRILLGLYAGFVEMRRNDALWKDTVEAMRVWVAERKVRA